MDFLLQHFSLPLWVGLIVGIGVYLIKFSMQRRAIACALVTDINSVLKFVREINEYLKKNDHLWLTIGHKVKRGPTDTGPSARLYAALLPNLYMLPKRDLSKVLCFYQHYQLCENLVRSLYEHIRDLARLQEPLGDSEVKILQEKRDRICKGFDSLLKTPSPEITGLKELPDTYSIPSTKETADRLNALVRPMTANVSVTGLVSNEAKGVEHG